MLLLFICSALGADIHTDLYNLKSVIGSDPNSDVFGLVEDLEASLAETIEYTQHNDLLSAIGKTKERGLESINS